MMCLFIFLSCVYEANVAKRVDIINFITSSKLKRTPPIGAPNATETPAAAAADKICWKKQT